MGQIVRVDEENPDGGTALVTTYTYDGMGNLVHKNIDSGLYSEDMSYNCLGWMRQRTTNLGGYIVHYYYDFDTTSESVPGGFEAGSYSKRRLVRDLVVYPDDTAIESFYSYDWKGNLKERAEVIGAKDSSGQITGEVFKRIYTLYDRQRNLRQIVHPSGLTVSYNYSDRGVLRWIGVGGVPVFGQMVTSAHGGMEFMRLLNSEGHSVNWAKSYNARLLIAVSQSINEGTPPDLASVLFSLDYSSGYDKSGDMKGITRSY